MWRWNKRPIDEGQFKQFESEIFRALEPNATEIETAANSPFLYRRLRVRIEAEAKQRAEASKQWVAWLVTARQAAPALAMVALLAIVFFWHSPNNVASQNEAELVAPGV